MPAVGDLVRSDTAAWVTLAPTHCPNGHRLGGGQVLVGHLACLTHGGHTTWTCLTCDATVYGPALAGCRVLNGPAEVRNSFRSSRG